MAWNDAQMEVQPFLQSGESLLWSGRPRGGVRLTMGDVVMIPFSLMWGGFAIFWEFMVIRSHAPLFMVVWGLPFVAIGLYLIVGRFFFDAARRAGTVYAVTSERIFMVSGRGKNVASYPLGQIPGITTVDTGEGFGSVMLMSAPPVIGALAAGFASRSSRRTLPVLEMVESPKLVAETIERAQRELASRR
jgi:hypothetical protein